MTEPSIFQNPDSSIAISSIITAFHCPRQYFFYKDTPSKPADNYSICKQVSCADQDTSEEELWNTIRLIHPDISEEKKGFLRDCLKATEHAPVRPWTETDIPVRSKRAGIHGLLDKYHAPMGEYTLTRCKAAPQNGCWPEDAIRSAALLLCIEETGPLKTPGLSIEYVPSGIIRYYEPTPKDRRRVIHLIRQVKEIEKGGFPQKPLNPPCSRCRFSDRCSQNEPRRLSFLLKK